MSMPVVSIIVPNYNHSKYLEQRFESIFEQTYQDFEVIILDDCSTDNSQDIIECYRSNPKVSHIIYNEVNSGSPFKQWHKGLQMAKGEYVWIAESDDTCDRFFLETLITQIHKTSNCVVAYCGTNNIDKDGLIISSNQCTERSKIYSGKSFVVNKLLFGNCIYNASCVVFKRTSALSVPNGWINSRGAGDYYFWLYLSGFGNVYSLSQPLTYRRIHDTNVTHKANSSGSNLRDERNIVDYIYSKYHIAVWKKMLAENLRRRRISNENFDNEIIREDLFSLWNYGRKLKLLAKLITKAYFTLIKFSFKC